MISPILSIIIPTYNRPISLRRQLAALKDHMREDVRIGVIDNGSDEPAADAVNSVFGDDAPRVRVIRNTGNYGLSANLIKCFEFCETEWLWILGDDDVLMADGVETAVQTITVHPDHVYFNFMTESLHQSRAPREAFASSAGISGLVANLTSFSSLIFNSASLFRVPALRNYVKFGYYFADTYAPHIAIILAYLSDHPDARAALVNREICRWKSPSKEEGGGWEHSIVDGSLRKLLSIVEDQEDRGRLFHLMSDAHPAAQLSRWRIIQYLLSRNRESFRERVGLFLRYWGGQMTHVTKTPIGWMLDYLLLLSLPLIAFAVLLGGRQPDSISDYISGLFNTYAGLRKSRRL